MRVKRRAFETATGEILSYLAWVEPPDQVRPTLTPTLSLEGRGSRSDRARNFTWASNDVKTPIFALPTPHLSTPHLFPLLLNPILPQRIQQAQIIRRDILRPAEIDRHVLVNFPQMIGRPNAKVFPPCRTADGNQTIIFPFGIISHLPRMHANGGMLYHGRAPLTE